MSYPDENFDIVLDKSTIDALLTGGAHAHIAVAKMMKECKTRFPEVWKLGRSFGWK